MFTEIRFKLLAFVPTLTGVAVTLLTNRVNNQATTLAVGLLGGVVTLGILFYEMRNTSIYNAAVGRGSYLEKCLQLPMSTGDDGTGGVFAERPKRRTLFCNSNVFRQLYQLWTRKESEPTQQPVLLVWHDLALALIYGSALSGWVYIITNSLLTLLVQQRSGATVLASFLTAMILAFLCIRGLIRYYEGPENPAIRIYRRPGPGQTAPCNESTEVR